MTDKRKRNLNIKLLKKKFHISIVTGGTSVEREISLLSAQNFLKECQSLPHHFYLIDITKEGWYYVDDKSKKISIDKADFTLKINNKKIIFDLVIPILHGSPVEDGKLLSYFDILQIPYIGCNAFVSALTFSKFQTNQVVKSFGITVSPSVLLNRSMFNPSWIKANKNTFSYPIFLKPNKAGSSFGASKVSTQAELQKAISKAFKIDDEIIIEQFIQGREITVGVLKMNNTIHVLPITEIQTKNTFFDFKAKYKGQSKEITPADLPQHIVHKIHQYVKTIYCALSCEGIVRIDFIWSEKKKEIFFLEINTNPGLTSVSLVPQQLQHYKMTIGEVYSHLIKTKKVNFVK